MASTQWIHVRKITLDALGAVLGSSWQPVAKLTTGYSSHREDVRTGYAFQRPDGPALYGCIVDGVLSQLHITHISHSATDTLHQLGSTFGLILCDLWRDAVVELADRSAVDAYCTDE